METFFGPEEVQTETGGLHLKQIGNHDQDRHVGKSIAQLH